MLLSWRSTLKRARRAARSGNWAQAATAYRRHLQRDPHDAAIWVQLGHSLKEQGGLEAAASAYRQATRITPGEEDGWIHLAHLERRLGDREGAIRSLEQAIAAAADGGRAERAVAALIEMGARERLPFAIQARIEARDGSYAASRYTAYLAAQPRSTIAPATGAGMLAVIDARGATPELVETTRATLEGTGCLILTDEAVSPPHASGASHFLLVEAGTRIATDAIARLGAALAETGAGAAYCDHDHWELAGPDVIRHDPCFQPMFDSVWFSREAVRPPCMLVTAAAVGTAPSWAALFAERLSLPGCYAHVPMILASRRAGTSSSPADPAPIARAAGTSPIQVIIQTRDAPAMLERCVTNLLRTADHPDRLDIVIVDNRSTLTRTAVLLAEWSAQGISRVIAHDEPFNWARANNLAVRQGQAPLLLFLNNDVEMDSQGWDTELRDGLAQDGVGAMGALLLYPDRLIQHAGVIFGVGEGGAVHEGVGRLTEPGGPGARWRYPRLASAVTGAWMATSRELFDAVDGFEERLPIAYNDIDFCLRCRAAGRLVVQASQIVAVHRESATRGSVMSPAEHARDQSDWAWLRTRWGEALDLDPAYNPNWIRAGQPFDGLQVPSPAAVVRWITASARPQPWLILPPA